MDSERNTTGLTLEELQKRQQEMGIEAAVRKGELLKERILSGEGMLTSDEAAMRLGTSIEVLDAMAFARRVLRLEGKNSKYGYPSFQFDGHVLPLIEQILAAMPDHSPWSIYFFLTEPEPLLHPGTPLEWIKCGKEQDVLRVAKLLNDEYV